METHLPRREDRGKSGGWPHNICEEISDNSWGEFEEKPNSESSQRNRIFFSDIIGERARIKRRLGE
ncbi:MAG: hypothetical protein ACD_58C00292G0003 [uncultured bacterium]|nr:MAG: hypothetical protein ACD_58C00292G0003 [uncultured bacterium]